MIVMRLSCPTCSTEYEVPDAAIGGRSRKLRCGQCGYQWRLAFEAEQDWAVLAPEAPAWPVDAREPAGVSAWPQVPEDLNVFPPAVPQFGKPMDAAVQVEISEAVAQEEAVPDRDAEKAAVEAPDGDHGLPTFLTAERGGESGLAPEPDEAAAETSRFAELIYAARNSAAAYEPEASRRGARSAGRHTLLKVILLLVLLVVAVLLEHRLVIRFLPASARLFQALGLR
jgi:predicted Zn finger-like uncharacterized protein